MGMGVYCTHIPTKSRNVKAETAPLPTSSGLPVLIPELSTDMAEG